MTAVLLAGGGTGGHVYPGLAIARAVRELSPDAKIFFAATGRPIDRQILTTFQSTSPEVGLQAIYQPIQPFVMNPIKSLAAGVAWWTSFRQLSAILAEHQVQAVIGLGGFGSSAALVAAGSMKLRRAILNPDAVPGKANQLFGKRVDRIFAQWDVTEDYFDDIENLRVVGCPLRKEIKELAGKRESVRAQAAELFRLRPDRRTLFVWGGSTGARSINQAVMTILKETPLPNDLQILHMTGKQDFDTVRTFYAQSIKQSYSVLEYIDQPHLALALADLVIGRSGAVGLAELAALGVPSILLPYPYHKDQHQKHNAQVLVDAGGAIIVDDDKVGGPATVSAMRQALMSTLLGEPGTVELMSQALLTNLHGLNADVEVARWMLGQDTPA